jgi:alpha-beta hydrolase superfamily lysophospholipase
MMHARQTYPYNPLNQRRSRWLSLLAATALLVPAWRSAAGADDKQNPTPPPEQVSLRTSDGVTLAATYYPSPLKSGKDAAAVILVHANKGNRGDFAELAQKLQEAGHAVIAPDLRGHGDSSGPDGELGAADFAAMVRQDLEAVKRFLVDKNNAGQLNIERLGVVGIELGASVAINWAALDWSWPMLATGKQGQDVKALALVSPQWSYKGMRIDDAVTHPNIRRDLSVLIVAGRRNSKQLQAARRLHNALARYHSTPPRAEAAEKQTLWLKTPATSLQGTRLMDEDSLQVNDMILNFVELRLANPALPWQARTSPLN